MPTPVNQTALITAEFFAERYQSVFFQRAQQVKIREIEILLRSFLKVNPGDFAIDDYNGLRILSTTNYAPTLSSIGLNTKLFIVHGCEDGINYHITFSEQPHIVAKKLKLALTSQTDAKDSIQIEVLEGDKTSQQGATNHSAASAAAFSSLGYAGSAKLSL